MDPNDPIHRLLRFAVFTLEMVGIRPSVKYCPNCRCIQNDTYIIFKFDSSKRTRSCVMVIKYASLKNSFYLYYIVQNSVLITIKGI